MASPQWAVLIFQLSLLLLGAMAFGRVARRFGLPPLVGEVLGGALLGPTLLGRVWPEAQAAIFPATGPIPGARDAFARTGMLAFILTIGVGISLDEFRQIGKRALWVGCIGTFVPLFAGFAMVYGFPNVMEVSPKNQFPVAVMMGSILSLSANPVIARILLELGLMRSEAGRVIMSATLVDDLVGWGIFAVLLAEFGPAASAKPGSGAWALLWVGVFVALVLFGGRWLFPKLLVRIERSGPPGSVITGLVAITFLCAAGAEKLGVHAFLGAFLVGIALADARRFHPALDTIGKFAVAVITPIFFMSMGIGVDFVKGFDLAMVSLVTFVAFFGKIVGATLGGRVAGMDLRTSFAVGCGLNARGILGIVMASAARDNQLISERVFVACIIMCLLTTAVAGPSLHWVLKRGQSATAEQ